MLFVLVGICLSALISVYWVMVLEPRLESSARATAGVLSQSQAKPLATALLPVNGKVDPRAVDDAINELLVLVDPNTHQPFVVGVEIEVDYDIVPLQEGEVRLQGGDIYCPQCLQSKVALYSRGSTELLGIARIYSSTLFLQQLKTDVREKLFSVSIAGLLVLLAAWYAIAGLMHKMRAREDDLRRVFEAAPFPMILVKQEDNSIMAANEAALTFFKVPADALDQVRTPEFYVDLEDRKKMLETLYTEGRVEQMEIEMRNSEGEAHWVMMSVMPVEYRDEQAIVVGCSDITERKIFEHDLIKMATIDTLTGVFNRRQFYMLAESEFQRSRRYAKNFCTMMIDIDHFKRINDAHGHHVGDKTLKVMAMRCSELLREVDLFGRVGGEEFAVVLPETDQANAERLAERLRIMLSQSPVALDDRTLNFTVSIGLAHMHEDDQDLESILQRADTALYAAKRAGRNRVVAA